MHIKSPINKPRWFGLTGLGGATPEPPPAPNGERIIYGCGLEGTSIDFNPDEHGEGVYIVSPSMSNTFNLYGTVSIYRYSETFGGTRGVYIRDYYVSNALVPPDEREETHIRGRFIAEDTLKMITDVPRIGARRKLKEGQYLICPQCVLWNYAFTSINLGSGEPNSNQFSSSSPYYGLATRDYNGDDKYLKLELDDKYFLGHTVNIENYEVIGDMPTDYVIGAIFNIRPFQYVGEKGLEFINPQRFINYDLNDYASGAGGGELWNPKTIICSNYKYNQANFYMELNFPQISQVGDTEVTLEYATNGVYRLVKGDEPISLEEAKPFIEGGTIVERLGTGYVNIDGSVGTGIPIGFYAMLCFGGGS